MVSNWRQTGNPPLLPHCKNNEPLRIIGCWSSKPTDTVGRRPYRNDSTAMPRLLHEALSRQNAALFALTLDLIVPPLSLLALMVAAILVISAIISGLGVGSGALMISVIAFLALALSVSLAWINYGCDDVLPLRLAFSVFGYAFAKLPLYRKLLSSREAPQWVEPIEAAQKRHQPIQSTRLQLTQTS